MQLRSAFAAALLVSAAGPAFAIDPDPCVGPKPFREVAQDEIRTIPELCGLHDQIFRGEPEWQGGAPADPVGKELEPPAPSAARRAALQQRHY